MKVAVTVEKLVEKSGNLLVGLMVVSMAVRMVAEKVERWGWHWVVGMVA